MIPASKCKGGVCARACVDMRSDQKVLSLKSLCHINHSVRVHACIDILLHEQACVWPIPLVQSFVVNIWC